ncbi:hypothetical protein D3C78_1558220 [compost metagenome]
MRYIVTSTGVGFSRVLIWIPCALRRAITSRHCAGTMYCFGRRVTRSGSVLPVTGTFSCFGLLLQTMVFAPVIGDCS